MPADFPHWRSVYVALDGWGKSGATEAMHDELRRACRTAAIASRVRTPPHADAALTDLART
jgi:hypothetical protein